LVVVLPAVATLLTTGAVRATAASSFIGPFNHIQTLA
jgi:hypothetical protein